MSSIAMLACILVIDDDPELRKIYRHTLERADYRVVEAEDGESALRIIHEAKPNVIILDMMMPKMNGEMVLQAIRQNPSLTDARLVVITAYPQYRESALHFGVDQFLTKPVHPAEIVSAVGATLIKSAG